VAESISVRKSHSFGIIAPNMLRFPSRNRRCYRPRDRFAEGEVCIQALSVEEAVRIAAAAGDIQESNKPGIR
jgi:hypothetical protein